MGVLLISTSGPTAPPPTRGNGEKFYPSFFNYVQKSECLFTRLSKNSSLFLGFDQANHIVAFLSQKTFSDISAVEFAQKEKAIICYLGGYEFATLSRRIRNSKNWNSKASQDNLKIVIAGKALNGHDDLTFVDIKDRGVCGKFDERGAKYFLLLSCCLSPYVMVLYVALIQKNG